MDRVSLLTKNISDDEAFIISGKANIFYYSGFTSEDAFLFLSKNRRALITDSRYTVQAKEQTSEFEIFTNGGFWETVTSKQIGFEEEKMTVAEKMRYEEKCKAAFVPKQREISKLRQVKDKCEIQKIANAEALGDEAFSHILDYIKPGVTENEIAFELECFMKKNGASDVSFETICASGARGAMPHGTASNKVIEKGDMVTLDFGCILDGYCSDMTRTVAVGEPNTKLGEIYNIVLEAQTAALKFLKAGVKCSDADKIARDIISSYGYGECFGHSLGHSLGIEIHENPNLSRRSNDILQIGNVVTVEPGIYVEGLGGVRIEDVAVIEENGCKNITASEKNFIIL